MHFAGELVERGGKLRGRQSEKLADRRQAGIEGRVVRAADRLLVRR